MYKVLGQPSNPPVPTSATRSAALPRARVVRRAAAGSVTAAPRPDRRAAILLAAEKLFSLQGYHAVSLRQIAAEAGVPLALVGYYYGAKHELFQAIFEHWQPNIDQRLALLRAVMAGTEPPSLRAVVRAFVEPSLALRASSEGEYYARLVAHELVTSAAPEVHRVVAATFDPMAHTFIDALCQLRPHGTRARAAWAYQFATGALLHHMVDTRVQRLSGGVNQPADAAAAPQLIDFITAGIDAVLSSTIRNPEETLQ